MTPGNISKRVVTDRLGWVRRMISNIRALPLEDRAAFFADYRNPATAESSLRRALEALFDLGRHILAKGFGQGVSEYKEIAAELGAQNVLSQSDAELLRTLAGYRNRMVHFYHDIAQDEFYEICTTRLSDVERISAAYQTWLNAHPERLDDAL